MPLTLNLAVLMIFIAITIGLGVLLGILQWSNGRQGGLFFAEHISNLPVGNTFLYLYLPTILAVLYSTSWSWIDLDVKRLELWFQLTKADGAASEDSLLLEYPVEFLAFVPFQAAKRRFGQNHSHVNTSDNLPILDIGP